MRVSEVTLSMRSEHQTKPLRTRRGLYLQEQLRPVGQSVATAVAGNVELVYEWVSSPFPVGWDGSGRGSADAGSFRTNVQVPESLLILPACGRWPLRAAWRCLMLWQVKECFLVFLKFFIIPVIPLDGRGSSAQKVLQLVHLRLLGAGLLLLFLVSRCRFVFFLFFVFVFLLVLFVFLKTDGRVIVVTSLPVCNVTTRTLPLWVSSSFSSCLWRRVCFPCLNAEQKHQLVCGRTLLSFKLLPYCPASKTGRWMRQHGNRNFKLSRPAKAVVATWQRDHRLQNKPLHVLKKTCNHLGKKYF